jgi:RNA polymerase sigma factor (sigma-70 family)
LNTNVVYDIAKTKSRKVEQCWVLGRGPKLLDKRRRLVVEWVVANVIPHEANVRNWLQQARVSPPDIDDLIQEAYCRLARLDSVDHIDRPDGYFFQIVRNLHRDQIRRARIVRIDFVGEMSALSVCSEEPSLERVVAATRELEQVRRLIRRLPPLCREVIELRKVDGVPQKEIARRLGLSESTVENEAVRGTRLIMEALRKVRRGTAQARTDEATDDRPRKFK